MLRQTGIIFEKSITVHILFYSVKAKRRPFDFSSLASIYLSNEQSNNVENNMCLEGLVLSLTFW